jgi:hypothetical protein
MAYKLEIYYSSTWYDVSNYVIDCSPIPIFQRNKNGEPSFDGFDFEVSENYNNTRLEGCTKVRFDIDGTVKFVGTVYSRQKDYKNRSYKFEILSELALLDNYFVDQATMNSTLTGSGNPVNYIASDNASLPNARLVWIWACMFADAGLSFDYTTHTVANQTFVENKYIYNPGTSHDPATQEDFTIGDVRIDVNMLYCLNQSYAMNSTKITSNDISGYSTEAQKITFGEFIKKTFAAFNVMVYYSGSSWIIKYVTSDESYTVADDDKYEYVDDVYEDALSGDYNVTFNANSRNDYNDTTADAIAELKKYGGKSRETISWINSLVFLIHGKWSGASTGDVYPFSSSFGTGYNWVTATDGTFFDRYINEITQDFTGKTYETTVKTDVKNVIQNAIDLKTRRSKIFEGGY